MKQHKQYHISGRVQGVGYRMSAQRKAEELGINGFVRNQSDGSVYAEAEGTEEQLKSFEAWCRKGPGFAKVERVEVNDAEPKSHQGFQIMH